MSASDNSAQPLSRQPGIVTSTTEELREIYSRVSTPITVEPIGRATRSDVRMHHVAFGPLRLHSFASVTGLRAHTPHNGDVYIMSHGRAGVIDSWNGGREVPMHVGRFASLASPGDAIDVVAHPGHVGIELVMPRVVVESAYTALTGPQARHLRLAPSFSLTTPRGAAAMRLHTVIEHELDHQVLSGVPSITARLADSLVHAVLLAQTSQDELAPLDPGVACLRQVEEYVEANLSQPITLSDLGAISGVRVRVLQSAFRAHRHCSPLQFLRMRRLERAHAMLASGDDVRVTDVALACSFEHFGRFSGRYRER